MKFQQVLTNKKIVIVVIALFLVLCSGMIYFIGSHQKNSENTGENIQTEQDEVDAIGVDDNKTSDADEKEEPSTGLEILKPDEVVTENITDVSGSWENTQESEQGPQDESKQDDNKEEQDILEDDITWGDIY